MYPISLVLDCLQDDIRRFRTRFEAPTEDRLELVRNGDVVSVGNTKVIKYLKNLWPSRQAAVAAPGAPWQRARGTL
jgi:hypothetical protein